MNRQQKINLLKSWNVTAPDGATDAQLDALIERGRPQILNKVVDFSGGKIVAQWNKADDEPVAIQIYEDIGADPWSGAGFTAKDFSEILADISPRTRTLDLRINSAGGLVWEGFAIKTLLDEWPGRKTASIDGMAASTASFIPMACDEIRAPRHAQMFIHKAWGGCVGNDDDMFECGNRLLKTTKQIAQMYADRTGMTLGECMELMTKNTLLNAEEAHAMGFIDVLTDEAPAENYSAEAATAKVSKMRAKLSSLWNSISKTAPQGQTKNKKEDTMNRENKIALLNKWGVEIPVNAPDEQLDALIEAGKPQAKVVKLPKAKAPKSKAPRNAESEDDGDDDGEDDEEEGEDDKASLRSINAELKQMRQARAAERKTVISNRVKALVESDRIPAGLMDKVTARALTDESILDEYETLPARPPGIAPLNIVVGESSSITDLNRNVKNLLAPQKNIFENRRRPDDMERKEIGSRSAQVSALINSMKQYDANGNLSGPLRQAWDAWASGLHSPQNANTMSADLLRQVILSEIMRAFRRRFASLDIFAHTYQNVPLEGSDYVKVPYYPLDTVASQEFVQANGYQITANAVTNAKSIFVGGIGNNVATAGSGRKYKGLQFSAYEIRRQPWLNIAQLVVLAAEQLAIDVRADILGAHIKAANFGNAIWTGASGAFDSTVMAQYLMNAAEKAYWPVGMRNAVLGVDYYTALAADPYVKAFLNIGDTNTIRQGKIGGLYGFQDTIMDNLLPIANFIRGGDGVNTAGADLNLAGFIAYPSAILIATAPIMPPPGVLKKLVAYEQVTDDQTGLTFSYQYWGDEAASVDNEIIECTYGSNVGELAALKRITSAGV